MRRSRPPSPQLRHAHERSLARVFRLAYPAHPSTRHLLAWQTPACHPAHPLRRTQQAYRAACADWRISGSLGAGAAGIRRELLALASELPAIWDEAVAKAKAPGVGALSAPQLSAPSLLSSSARIHVRGARVPTRSPEQCTASCQESDRGLTTLPRVLVPFLLSAADALQYYDAFVRYAHRPKEGAAAAGPPQLPMLALLQTADASTDWCANGKHAGSDLW